MMMECPRCGFVQPQDRFCANCGLNIATYEAKPKPFWQQLKANQAAYVGLAVLLLIGVVWYLRRADFVPSARPGIVMPNTAPVVGGSTGPTGSMYTNNQPRPAVAPPPSAPSQTPTPPTETALGTPTSETPPAADTAAATPGTTPTPPPAAAAAAAPKALSQIEIQFYEIPHESWQPVASEGKVVGDQGSWRVLQFAQKEKLNSALAAARRLPGQRQLSTQPSSTAAMDFPLGSAEGAQGLFFDFSVIKLEPGQVELEIVGQLDVRFDATDDVHARLESVANVPTSGAVVVVGSIPRKALPPSLVNLVGTSPLSILNSEDYRQGQSEFLLVIMGK